jgi:hypothetical protein
MNPTSTISGPRWTSSYLSPVDCNSGWANAALIERLAAIRATTDIKTIFDKYFPFDAQRC